MTKDPTLQVLYRCPKCLRLWRGPGVHGLRWKLVDGVQVLLDCLGQPVPEVSKQ